MKVRVDRGRVNRVAVTGDVQKRRDIISKVEFFQGLKLCSQVWRYTFNGRSTDLGTEVGAWGSGVQNGVDPQCFVSVIFIDWTREYRLPLYSM